MAMSSFAKSSAATTCARATPDADFKACCMNSGAYDGVNRSYYFQGVEAGKRGLVIARCVSDEAIQFLRAKVLDCFACARNDGWREAAASLFRRRRKREPESRDFLMRNCASEVRSFGSSRNKQIMCQRAQYQGHATTFRHGRARPGHLRLCILKESKTWMPGTRPVMTRVGHSCPGRDAVRSTASLSRDQ